MASRHANHSRWIHGLVSGVDANHLEDGNFAAPNTIVRAFSLPTPHENAHNYAFTGDKMLQPELRADHAIFLPAAPSISFGIQIWRTLMSYRALFNVPMKPSPLLPHLSFADPCNRRSTWLFMLSHLV